MATSFQIWQFAFQIISTGKELTVLLISLSQATLYHPFPFCYHRAMSTPKSQGWQPAFLAFAPVHGGCICPIKTDGDHPINLEGWDGEGGGCPGLRSPQPTSQGSPPPSPFTLAAAVLPDAKS